MKFLKRLTNFVRGPYSVAEIKCPFCRTKMTTTDWKGEELVDGKLLLCSFCGTEFRVTKVDGVLQYVYPVLNGNRYTL